MALPFTQAVIKAVQSTVDYPVPLNPMMGGSLQLYLFEKDLNTKPIYSVCYLLMTTIKHEARRQNYNLSSYF
jgi:hypothetical protein